MLWAGHFLLILPYLFAIFHLALGSVTSTAPLSVPSGFWLGLWGIMGPMEPHKLSNLMLILPSPGIVLAQLCLAGITLIYISPSHHSPNLTAPIDLCVTFSELKCSLLGTYNVSHIMYHIRPKTLKIIQDSQDPSLKLQKQQPMVGRGWGGALLGICLQITELLGLSLVPDGWAFSVMLLSLRKPQGTLPAYSCK